MPAPPPMKGYTVEAARAWQMRCNGCGRRSPILADEPDPFLEAEGWARAHLLDCPVKESSNNSATRVDRTVGGLPIPP